MIVLCVVCWPSGGGRREQASHLELDRFERRDAGGRMDERRDPRPSFPDVGGRADRDAAPLACGPLAVTLPRMLGRSSPADLPLRQLVLDFDRER